MTLPTTVLSGAVLTAPAEHWRDDGVRAELRLTLEEQLGRWLRAEDADVGRVETVHYFRRHTWTDETTGLPCQWDEQSTPGQASHVMVRLEAVTYPPGP